MNEGGPISRPGDWDQVVIFCLKGCLHMCTKKIVFSDKKF